MEAKMHPGDHWRIMEQLLKRVKTDLQNVQNVSKPDPNKVAKAKEMKVRIEKLYDQHINRIKVAKKIMSDVVKARKIDTSKIDQLWYEGGSIADIIDALTGGEIMDYELKTGENVLYAGHPSGYYSMRQTKRGPIRNHKQSSADRMRRVEIWAQFFQFGMYEDKSSYNLVKKLMPETANKFETLIKMAENFKLTTSETFDQTIFNEEIPVAAEIKANPRMDSETMAALEEEARKSETAEDFIYAEKTLPVASVTTPVSREKIISQIGKIQSRTPDAPVVVNLENGKVVIKDGNQRYYQKIDEGAKTIQVVFIPESDNQLMSIWERAQRKEANT